VPVLKWWTLANVQEPEIPRQQGVARMALEWVVPVLVPALAPALELVWGLSPVLAVKA